MRLRLTNCTIIDAVHPEPQPNAYLDIEDGRIRALGPMAAAPDLPGAETLDLGGAYVTPGLFDTHIHLFHWDTRKPHPNNVAAHAFYCQQNAINALQAGFTGIRAVGDGYFVDVALRDAFNQGPVLGPRLWVTGYFLTPTAGHCAALEGDMWCVKVVDGVDGWRKAAREQIQHGVDFVKITVTGGAMGPAHDLTAVSNMTEEEFRAAAQVALDRGKGVIAHAAGPEGVKMAVRNGAYSIEHGYYLDEEAVELMAKHGTYLAPTFGITHLIPDYMTDEYEWATYNKRPRPPGALARARERVEAHRRSFRLAVEAGVKIVNGSDMGPFPGPNHLEISFLVRYGGLTPWQALVASTKTAAECCGAGDDTGTLEVGKRADLLAVDKNPLEDVKHLREPRLVLKDGRVAVNTFSRTPTPVGIMKVD
ncbi:MAG: amidohydrolase family protein [Chloroflexi bacterium]|nr:amidohydrolase family protein [Chloroflexota bacterium]